LVARGQLKKIPLLDSVSAISVGIVDGTPLLDLDYAEDSRAAVDMNFVITGSGHFVEVQGTAEADPFSVIELDQLRDLALKGCSDLRSLQQQVLAGG
ncbi:MAG: ribonuclease PH, partial [Pelovirga sp.]